jgi:hypothetical protein
MKARSRAGLAVLVLVGAGLLARNAVAQMLVTFEAPHRVRAPAAALDVALGHHYDAQAAATKMATIDDLVAFTLRTTASALHFGLRHRTRLSFDEAEREGNCVEYADLFATVFNREHTMSTRAHGSCAVTRRSLARRCRTRRGRITIGFSSSRTLPMG